MRASSNAIEASEEALKQLLGRRLDELELLVIYVDGKVFGHHHMISAAGVDTYGRKHVLGIQQGRRKNAAAVEHLLQLLVTRGVQPTAKLLFVIDGASAAECDSQSHSSVRFLRQAHHFASTHFRIAR